MAAKAVVLFALRDAIVRWRSSAATIVLVAAVTAPLLVFFALRAGYVSELRANLENAPSMRELKLDGQLDLSAAWFEAMSSNARVEFIVPRTRHLNTSIKLRSPANRSLLPIDVELIPTGALDPLITADLRGLAADEAVLVTARAARQLNLIKDQAVEAIIRRTTEKGPEVLLRRFKVAAVLPSEAHARDALFVDPALMLGVERFREGEEYDVSPLRLEEKVASFRLFATDTNDVKPLALALEGQGMLTITSAAKISEIKSAVQATNIVVGSLGTILALGGIISIASGLAAAVISSASDLSVLRMLGYRSSALVFYPLTLAISFSLIGAALGFALYAMTARVIDAALPKNMTFNTAALETSVDDALITLLIAILAGLVAALGSARHALNLDATKRLRNG